MAHCQSVNTNLDVDGIKSILNPLEEMKQTWRENIKECGETDLDANQET